MIRAALFALAVLAAMCAAQIATLAAGWSLL